MSKSQPGPWWSTSPTSRPVQQRLLLLVLAFGLTLILMREARQPDRWQWLWAAGGRRPAATGHSGRAAASSDSPTSRSPSPAVSSSTSPNPSRQLLPGVDREALAAIEDNTVFRPAERAAWFNLFGVLKARDAEQLQRESTGVSFIQLFEQPDQYRAQLVTFRGQARRALLRPAPSNDLGIEAYYQIVLRPADGPNSPLIVYCLDLPKGFPTGDGIREDVTVVGLFFKNWAFATQDDIRSSPTLLARTLGWEPAVPEAVEPVETGQVITMVVATAISGVLFAIWIVRRGNRQIEARRAVR